jgi:hypothetical protein
VDDGGTSITETIQERCTSQSLCQLGLKLNENATTTTGHGKHAKKTTVGTNVEQQAGSTSSSRRGNSVIFAVSHGPRQNICRLLVCRVLSVTVHMQTETTIDALRCNDQVKAVVGVMNSTLAVVWLVW